MDVMRSIMKHMDNDRKAFFDSGDVHKLLNEIHNEYITTAHWPDCRKFRLKHSNHIELLDEMNRRSCFRPEPGHYEIPLTILRTTSELWSAEKERINSLFPALKDFYKSNMDAVRTIEELKKKHPDIPKADLVRSIYYLDKAQVLHGHPLEEDRALYMKFTIAENILRASNIDEAIDKFLEPHFQPYSSIPIMPKPPISSVQLEEKKISEGDKAQNPQIENISHSNLKLFLMNPWTIGIGTTLIAGYLLIHFGPPKEPSNIVQQSAFENGTNINANEVRIENLNPPTNKSKETNKEKAVLLITRSIEDGQKELDKIRKGFPGKISKKVSDLSKRGIFTSSIAKFDLEKVFNDESEIIAALGTNVERDIEDSLINNGFSTNELSSADWLKNQSQEFEKFKKNSKTALNETASLTKKWTDKTGF